MEVSCYMKKPDSMKTKTNQALTILNAFVFDYLDYVLCDHYWYLFPSSVTNNI